ncbi:MAG: hypothetical protein HOP29_08895, partial [Phycisphaerales bacterium]|nr:hypothetical protein [Phycisphaerales bacterium]
MQQVTDYHRFCPDRVEVKISDAVCIGRRRVNYPPCRGCQFNDDEKTVGKETGRVEAGAPIDDARIVKVFKAYDVRGVYP